ncbi:hypothetical protein [Terribacillus saccharophilus]|nr:hypothetical protein [Terribacillus saccharophilus]
MANVSKRSEESLVDFVFVKDEDIKPNPPLKKELEEWERLAEEM